ncbi:MAG: thioredoxin family protein [Promethearchaeota archaeon]
MPREWITLDIKATDIATHFSCTYMVEDVTPEEVEQAIKTTRLLLVDAWAPSCSPCKELEPIMDELEEMFAHNSDVRIVKVNTQEHIGFTTKYDIFAIPCILAFFDGKPAEYLFQSETGEWKKVDRLLGLRPFDHYEKMIRSLLGTPE